MATFVTSFALTGSRVSLTGGLYAYVEVAFGPFIGFLAGVLFFLTAVVSVSGIVSLFTGSFLVLVPSLDSSIGHFLIALLVFGVVAGVNVRGVRGGTRAAEVVTIIKLLPPFFFVGMGYRSMACKRRGSPSMAAMMLRWPWGSMS